MVAFGNYGGSGVNSGKGSNGPGKGSGKGGARGSTIPKPGIPAGPKAVRGGGGGDARFDKTARGEAQDDRQAKVASVRAAHANSGGKGFNSPLYNPTAVLSGKDLATSAQQIADAQTKGPISELAKQISTQNQTSKNQQNQTFGYYMSLAKAAQDAVGQQQGLATGLGQTQSDLAAGTQAQLSQLGQQAQGGAVGRMNALGLGGDSQAQLQAQTAQQQGVGALQAGNYQMAGANQGANYTGNQIANRGAYAMQGQQTLGNEARAGILANEPLNAKIAALDEKNGALKGTALGQLRQSERNYQIAQEGITGKANTLAVTKANDIAKLKLGLRGQNITNANNISKINATIRGQNITNANDLANQALHSAQLSQKAGNDAATQAWRQASLLAKSGKGGAKPLSTVANNKILTQLGEVVNAIPHLQQNGIKNAKGVLINAKPSQAEIKNLLGNGYNPNLIEAAYELLGYGSINRNTANNLRNMGIRGGTFRGAPIKVTPNYRPPSAKTIARAKGAVGGLL